MRLERYSTGDAVAARGADLVGELVARKPDAVLALPAGGTPVPLYAELARRQRAGKLDLRRTHLFQLDELVGVPPGDERSFHRFLKRHVVDSLGAAGRSHLLDGDAPDPESEIARHARSLAELGGADLVLLGLGRNGHVAFNEPGSAAGDGARVVDLCPTTRSALAPRFRADGPPRRGMTLGLAEIGAGKRIALLVTGGSKAEVLCALVRDAPSPERPATLLAGHRDFLVLADAEACRLLDERPAT